MYHILLGFLGLTLFSGVTYVSINFSTPEPMMVRESGSKISDGFNGLYSAVELYRKENGKLPSEESDFIGEYIESPLPAFGNQSGQWSYLYVSADDVNANAYICLNGTINDTDLKAVNRSIETIPGSGISLVISENCGDPIGTADPINPNGSLVPLAMTLWVDGPDIAMANGGNAWENFFTHHGFTVPTSWDTASLSLSSYPGHALTGVITNAASAASPYEMDSGMLPNEMYPSSTIGTFNLRNSAALSHVNSLISIKNATAIDLSSIGLTSVSGLSNLDTVSGSIDLSGNNLGSLNGLTKLTSVGSLTISGSGLSSIGNLSSLTTAQAINLSNNSLSNVNGLDSLTSLTSLDLNGNVISNLSGLSLLESVSGMLDLSSNQLVSLSGLGALNTVGSIAADHNQLSDVSALYALTDIGTLDLSHNNLLTINGLQGIINANQIDLSYNLINELSFNALSSVGVLDVSNNRLTSLSGMPLLLSVTHLFLANNQLTTLDGLENITSLTQLDVTGNPNLKDVKGLRNLASVSGYIDVATGAEFDVKNELTDAICTGIGSNLIPVRQGGASLTKSDALSLLCDAPEFLPLQVTFDTSLGTNTTVMLDVSANLGVPVDITAIDWGNEAANASCPTTASTAGTITISCSYPEHGIYNVSFYGVIPTIGGTQRGYSNRQLVSVDAFGTTSLTSLAYAFFNMSNLVSVPATLPAGVVDFRHAFRGAPKFNSDISMWDVSSATNMQNMFMQANTFNQPIGNWDVGNVEDMSYMFAYTPQFNQPIGSWDVSKVVDFRNMFNGAMAFNQPIGSWNTQSATTMAYMFNSAMNFNQPIGGWNLSNVTNLDSMLGNNKFNQPIGNWDTSSVTLFTSMFMQNKVFDQPIGGWNIGSAVSMASMFYDAMAFNQPIGSWNTSSVTQMSYMFNGARLFNQPLGDWNVSNVTGFVRMFSDAQVYNQDLACWDVADVATPSQFNYMANNAWVTNPALQPQWGASPSCSISDPLELVFDTNLGSDTNVTLPLHGRVDVEIDWGNEAANANCQVNPPNGSDPISCTYPANGIYTIQITGLVDRYGWDCCEPYISYGSPDEQRDAEKLISVNSFGNVGLTSLAGAFMSAENLVSVPDQLPATVTDLTQAFFYATSFNDPNIINWVTSSVDNMNATFSEAHSFNQPIGTWDVSNVTNMWETFYYASDFNQSLNAWNVSNVEDMDYMFSGAESFNQPLDNWNVSNVAWMSGTFESSGFNQPIGNWDVSSVQSMESTFADSPFNQPLNDWNVASVGYMAYMFANTSAFNQPIGAWDVGSVESMESMFSNAASFNRDISQWNVSNVSDMGYMFQGASIFNQNLSCWNTQISSKPQSFNQSASAVWVGNSAFQPQWGQPPICP